MEIEIVTAFIYASFVIGMICRSFVVKAPVILGAVVMAASYASSVVIFKFIL